MNIQKTMITLTLIASSLSITGCAKYHDNVVTEHETRKTTMKQHLIGRFSLDLPTGFTKRTAGFTFRDVHVKERGKKGANSLNLRDTWLKNLYAEAHGRLPRPNGKSMIAHEQNIDELGEWSRFFAYFDSPFFDDSVMFNLLTDYGDVIVHYNSPGDPDKYSDAFTWFSEIAKSYRPYQDATPTPGPGGFHLEKGYFSLPYDHQEETYAEFADQPLDLTLTFETLTAYQVEPSTLSDRIDAALLTWVIPGLSVDKIHSAKRELDGMEGSELIMRTTENNYSEVHFMWNYPGKVDSGEYPNIRIEMVTTEGDLKEQRQVWEQVLAGFRRIPGKIE